MRASHRGDGALRRRARVVRAAAACGAALRGTVAPSGACWSYADCDGGMCVPDAPCGGHCAAYAGEGEPCNGPCAPGLQCWWSPSSPYGTCTRPSGPGGPCPCGAGAYCDYGTFGAGGEPTAPPTCKAVHRSGFCSGPYECALGFTCAGAPSACVPLVGSGAPCGAAAVCGSGYYCDALSGRCAAFPGVGDTCVLERDGTKAELPCMSGRCDRDATKRCVALKAVGAPCTLRDECAGFCDPVQHQCTGWSVPPVCTPP